MPNLTIEELQGWRHQLLFNLKEFTAADYTILINKTISLLEQREEWKKRVEGMKKEQVDTYNKEIRATTDADLKVKMNVGMYGIICTFDDVLTLLNEEPNE